MTNMLIIIIGLLAYNYYYLLLYTRFHSSPVQHENLSSKVVLMGNSTKFSGSIKSKKSTELIISSINGIKASIFIIYLVEYRIY